MTDPIASLTITNPARKIFFLFPLLILLIGLWLGGVFLVGKALLSGEIREIGFFVVFFLLSWFAGWSLGGVLALYGLLWMAFGIETISAGAGVLTVTRTIPGYRRRRTYDGTKIRSLRLTEAESGVTAFLLSLRPFGISPGALSFDYHCRVVTFGEGIDGAEGTELLSRLRALLLTEDAPHV